MSYNNGTNFGYDQFHVNIFDSDTEFDVRQMNLGGDMENNNMGINNILDKKLAESQNNNNYLNFKRMDTKFPHYMPNNIENYYNPKFNEFQDNLYNPYQNTTVPKFQHSHNCRCPECFNLRKMEELFETERYKKAMDNLQKQNDFLSSLLLFIVALVLLKYIYSENDVYHVNTKTIIDTSAKTGGMVENHSPLIVQE